MGIQQLVDDSHGLDGNRANTASLIGNSFQECPDNRRKGQLVLLESKQSLQREDGSVPGDGESDVFWPMV